MVFCNFWRKFHVSAMSESKITANFWKLGGVVLLGGGNTGVSAYNPTKTDLMVFLAHLPSFLTISKLISKKKLFSLHPKLPMSHSCKTDVVFDGRKKIETFSKKMVGLWAEQLSAKRASFLFSVFSCLCHDLSQLWKIVLVMYAFLEKLYEIARFDQFF